ncbi:Wzz/FepE/Etk N-terminal domain-containing protein [Candidatus Thioglobus sp.]|nr:Wzz/FepE/Etk N-terminal domain-containing protein [Candidatus Thioglobus sp.]
MPQQNLEPQYYQDDGIDLFEIIQKLIASKKLIIVITLLITILGSIYSFQRMPLYQSTALVEIGQYQKQNQNQNQNQNQIMIQILIEPFDALILELSTNFIHNNKLLEANSENLEFKRIDKKNNKVLQIDFNSPSLATNKKIINELIIYIEKRHLDLKSSLIQNITARLEPINKNLKNSNARSIQFDNLLMSSNEFNELELQTTILKSQLEEAEFNFSLLQEQADLEIQLESLMNQNQSRTQFIGEIKVGAVGSKNKLIILISFILGLIFSIFVVLMKDLLKTFKERSA